MGTTNGEPSVGVVILTMGDRPQELRRAFASLQLQEGVRLDVAVVGNGWDPATQPGGLPECFVPVYLEENLGIPAGRNAGVPHVRGEFILFLDDDSWLPDIDFLQNAVARFRKYPDMGMLMPRIADPENEESPRRWIPRLNKKTAGESSNIFHVGETCLLLPRAIFEATRGWAGGFWYAHEGIELAWRVWDTGHRVWYAGDLRVFHPVVDPRRHGEFYRLNARNRVWLARRNLRWPFSWAYVGSWTLINIVRLRKDRKGLRQHLAGVMSGYRTSPWYQTPRPKLKWSTHLRMTLAGRPPII
ncbi:glycosyltransferase family 2 protein [Arthrobacter rhombi]|uniref:Glycosyltransferase n=1 Tax=Arthrobacter rhombi TaxID=71253 RepID=A0A1R4GBJ2_9MICC|nr:glycosyltransferase [Arthrobacter rhombi]SJM65610.1 Glycosyltransferase [Arthrobacter rhombi]